MRVTFGRMEALASCGEDKLRVGAATGKHVATCQGHTNKVVSVAPARTVRAGDDFVRRTVRQWDATGQEAEPPYDRHASGSSPSVQPGRMDRLVRFDRTIRVWRAIDRQDVAVCSHTGR